MKLTKRAHETLKWWHSLGLHPKSFTEGDEFVNEEGLVVFLEDADPKLCVWVPTLTYVTNALTRFFGVTLVVDRKPNIVLMSAKVGGVTKEGAGVTELDALLSFMENFKDAYSGRVASAAGQ